MLLKIQGAFYSTPLWVSSSETYAQIAKWDEQPCILNNFVHVMSPLFTHCYIHTSVVFFLPYLTFLRAINLINYCAANSNSCYHANQGITGTELMTVCCCGGGRGSAFADWIMLCIYIWFSVLSPAIAIVSRYVVISR